MTSPNAIAVHTNDRRLTAAVASFSGSTGAPFAEVGPRPPDPAPPRVVLDLRGSGASLVGAWAEAGSRALVVVDDAATAREALERGAADFVVGAPGEAEIAVRLDRLLRVAPDRDRSAALRRLVRHDIRSPLAVILGQCEILSLGLGGPLTDKQRKSLDAVERKATELRVMLDRLADQLGEAFGWEGHDPSGGATPR